MVLNEEWWHILRVKCERYNSVYKSCDKHGKMRKSQSFIIIANQKIKYNLSANMMSTILLCDHHTDRSNFIIVHSSWLHDIDIHVEG